MDPDRSLDCVEQIRACREKHALHFWNDVEKRVNRILARWVPDPEDRADVRQQCLIRVFRKLHTFEGRSAFSSWLYRVVRNEFASVIRRSEARREGLSRLHADAEPSSLQSSLEERVLARVTVTRMLADLGPLDGAILELRYLAGYRSPEVGKALGLASSTVRARLMKCRRRLRRP